MLAEKNLSFQLLKYVRPIWYFHLESKKSPNVWVDFEKLSGKALSLIHYDSGYSHPTICAWDASYQALMKGIVKKTGNNIQTDEIELLPADIYRFIRKYHKKIWLYIVFFQRLFSLFNPLSEFIGLWQTRHVQKYNLFHTHYVYDEYPDYYSSLIKSNPLLSIIIPTYNRYEPLNNLLKDLEEQTYSNFEVILIDQSHPFQKELYNNFNLRCHIIRQEDPALWKARNRGIKSAKSEYLLFLDDDSRIAPDWILEHLKCLDYFQADISSGVSKSLIGAKIPENYSFFRWSDQLDTGNVLIKKKVFEKCGLFDTKFEKMRMGDGEFGVRAYLSGFRNISNSKASREHLKIAQGGLRDMGNWDAFRPNNIFAPRPIPSVFYIWRKYWGNKTALLSCILTIPFSLSPYKYKSTFGGSIISCFLFILLFPIIIFQVSCAWVKSTNMIKKGSMVEKL